MKARVRTDNTTRTINLEVSGVPDIDVTTYHRKPRIFRPDGVHLKLVNGTLQEVIVSGGLVLKSGAASTEVRESTHYIYERELDQAPEWLRLLMSDAPQGVRTWATDADVQAL